MRQSMFFDPENKEHRRYYWEFLRTSSWGNCPYTWVIDDESASVPHMMHKKLVEYYLNKEFDKPVKS